MKWLIIGYGNTLRGDDGSGPYLIRQLRQSLPEGQVQLMDSQQLVPEMVEDILQPDIAKVLFVDVKRNQSRPCLLTPVTSPAKDRAVTHQVGPELLLFMAAELYAQRRRGWLLSLRGSHFAHSDQLSRDAKQALEKGVRLIEKLVSAGSGE